MKMNLKKFKREIAEEIRCLQKKMKKYPEGNLFCRRNGVHTKWYVRNQTTTVYLPKSQRTLAVVLAEKKYQNLQLKKLLLQRDCIQWYEKQNHQNEKEREALLREDSPYLELLLDNILTMPREARDWMSEEYSRNMLVLDVRIQNINICFRLLTYGKPCAILLKR